LRNWWVNQNQTYRQEIDGGYMWSPKVSKNGKLNPFYEFMREVAPGDLIFSFADTRIKAIGIALSPCYDCPRPPEFGAAGRVWGDTGWRVDVRWRELHAQIKPKDHMESLSPFLPAKYSPLQATGSGLQGIYLTELPASLADALVQLVGREAAETRGVARSWVSDVADPRSPAQAQAEWEEDLARRVEQDTRIPVTEKRQVILARRGQGKFRERVSMIERACRITRVNRPEHLIASHCKPWRDCESNDERLDGENGLLLTPTVDHLFDRGFISFENNGDLLISPVVHRESLKRMGIPPEERRNVGAFSEGQRRYLEYHRDLVFLEARVRRG
jgi:hypothetical protein